MYPYNVIAVFQERCKLSFFFLFKVIVKICAHHSDIFDKHMLVVLKSKGFSCFYSQRCLAMFCLFFSLVHVYVHCFGATTQSS